MALLALGSLGCSGFGDRLRWRLGGELRIEVVTTPLLNRDFPLAVDLVIAYDEDLFEALERLSAEEWFAAREQYLKDFATEMDSHYWEWMPGRRVEPQKLRYRVGARGGVLFAHYFTPGEHRVTIEPLDDFILRLGETEFEVRPGRER